MSAEDGDVPPPDDHHAELAELLEHLDDLEDVAESAGERETVQQARRRALGLAKSPRLFGNVIRGFDAADAAEVVLGSLLLGIPMLVEGGTLEIGEFLAGHPALLAGTVVADVLLVIGILYVADIQDVRVHDPLFGVVPRRLLGVLGIGYVLSLGLMTAWGRVDWADPTVAFAQCVVAVVPMTIGGSLGDILPGT